MMSKNVYKSVFALTAALMLALLPAAAFAAVEASAAADKTTVQAGDVVEVTITVIGKELAAVEGTYTLALDFPMLNIMEPAPPALFIIFFDMN